MGYPWSKDDELFAVDLNAEFDAINAKAIGAINTANAALPRAGGTMVGDLTLANDPTDDLHAATKRYVDAGGTVAQNALTIASAAKSTADGAVKRSGDTMAGNLDAPVLSFGSSYARKLTDRFAETIHVMDYGAKCDGITDDTAAVQAAVSACNSAGSGTLIFPRGTCNVSAGFTVNVPISFAGHGMRQSVIKNVNASLNSPIFLLSASASGSSVFRDFGISSVSGVGASCAGIQIDGGQAFKISKVEVSGTAIGINISKTQTGAWIDDCFIHNTTGAGVAVDAGNMTIRGCYTINCGGNGFQFTAVSGESAGLVVMGCTSFNSGGANFLFEGNAAHSIIDVVVSNCVSSSSPNGNGFSFDTHGRYVQATALFCELAGCNPDGTQVSDQNGILFGPNNGGALVSNCTAIGATGNGLVLDCSNISVSGGTFIGNGGSLGGISTAGVAIGVTGVCTANSVTGVNTSPPPGTANSQPYGINSLQAGNTAIITGCVLHGSTAAFNNTGGTATFANNLTV